MILFLVVSAAIIAVLYHSYGQKILWVAAIIASIYIIWFDKSSLGSSPKESGQKSVINFMKADNEMIALIKQLPIENKNLTDKLYKFYDTYLECFTTTPNKFDILTDTRREILNMLSIYVIENDVLISEDLMTGFSDCLWKYIRIISKKYDLSYSYPVASNTMDPRDLH